MNNQIPRNNISLSQAASVPYSRRLLNAGVAATLASVLCFVGVTHAQGQPEQQAAPQHEQHFRHGHRPMDSAHAEKRIEHRIDRMLTSVAATPEQKSKVLAIAKAAFDDLRPLREQSRAAHKENLKLLTQATIDRNAIEKVRVQEQQLADQRSRRITQAFEDAAEVLTPAQRVKLAEHMGKHHGHRFGHGPKKDEAAK
jgi:Spy/CpxP family protein refolding chaperone